jgi:hypothetical protein
MEPWKPWKYKNNARQISRGLVLFDFRGRLVKTLEAGIDPLESFLDDWRRFEKDWEYFMPLDDFKKAYMEYRIESGFHATV